jgi:hypothetical protein
MPVEYDHIKSSREFVVLGEYGWRPGMTDVVTERVRLSPRRWTGDPLHEDQVSRKEASPCCCCLGTLNAADAALIITVAVGLYLNAAVPSDQ